MNTDNAKRGPLSPLRGAALACCCGLLLSACAPQTAAPAATATPAPSAPTIVAVASPTTVAGATVTAVATATRPAATAAATTAPTSAATAAASPAGVPKVTVSFSGEVLPVFQQRCQGCHSGASAPKGLQLTDHANVMKVVDAGDPAGSKLYEMVESDRMPRGGPPLTAAQKELIRLWIAAGAPNN